MSERPSIEYMSQYFKNSQIEGAELGVFKGENALRFLNSLNIKKIHLVDSWITPPYEHVDNYEAFGEEVKNKFSKFNNVVIHKEYTYEAVKKFKDNSLDFVYVDAGHKYEECKKDIELWYPKIKSKGIMAGHDYFNLEEVKKAVDEFVFLNQLEIITFDAFEGYMNKRQGEFLIIKP